MINARMPPDLFAGVIPMLCAFLSNWTFAAHREDATAAAPLSCN